MNNTNPSNRRYIELNGRQLHIREVARQCGISASQLCRVFNKKCSPSLLHSRYIADVFEVSLDDLADYLEITHLEVERDEFHQIYGLD